MQAIDRRLVARVTLATLLIFGVAGCSSVNVKNQFDPDTDFTKYRRYAWVPNDELPPPEPTMQNTDTERRVKAEVDRVLRGKGLSKVSEDPSFLIAYLIGIRDRLNITMWGHGYGAKSVVGAQSIDPTNYREGILVIDIMDAESRDLLWRGTAEGVVDNYRVAQDVLREAVTKILDKFPPK